MSIDVTDIIKITTMVLFAILLVLGIVATLTSFGISSNLNSMELSLTIIGLVNLMIWFRYYA
ncbi:MAG: hypothetical protein ACTSR3_18480 [Candidatus Helarchaeota archaeon]